MGRITEKSVKWEGFPKRGDVVIKKAGWEVFWEKQYQKQSIL